MEEGKQDDTQILFAWVVLAGEPNCSIWLISINHINIGLSPDCHHELIILVLHDAACIHAVEVALVKKREGVLIGIFSWHSRVLFVLLAELKGNCQRFALLTEL